MAEPQVPGSISPTGIPAVSQAAPGAKVVEAGDIMDQLKNWSNEFGTDPGSILRENNITDTGDIRPGQMLTIPTEKTISERTRGLIDAPEGGDETGNLMTRLISGFDVGADEQFEDYSKGKVGVAGSEFSLEGAGEAFEVEPKPLSKQLGFEERLHPDTREPTGTFTFDAKNIEDTAPISEAIQFQEEDGVVKVPGEGEVKLEATEKKAAPEVIVTGEEKPSIKEGAGADIVEKLQPELPGEDLKTAPPTETELERLIKLLKPPSDSADKVYQGVIDKIGDIEFESDFDAKEFYKTLSENAERDTKKIDDSIAAIAEEKITPTFTGFNKFIAVLGAAMGAYGASITGGPNYALQIMNQAIDADQEQFLASKEIRTQSLLQQRQAVIQRRADLLQIGINQADRMLTIAQAKQGTQVQIATIQSIRDGLKNQQIEMQNENILTLIDLYSEKAAAKLLAKTAKTKDERERGVNEVEVINGDGETVVIEGYLAPTPKEGEKQRLIRAQTEKINTLLSNMHDLYADANLWKPGVINDSVVTLEQNYNELLLIVKNINQMGANFTVPEIKMITATIPTTDIAGKLTTGLVKIKNLRNKYISDERATMASYGYKRGATTGKKEKKKTKGQKTIYKAP